MLARRLPALLVVPVFMLAQAAVAAAPSATVLSVSTQKAPAAVSSSAVVQPAAVSASPVVQPAAVSATPAAAPAPSVSGPAESAGANALDVTPFYAFNWQEGLVIPSVGSWKVPANFGTSLGAKYPLQAGHALFGVYDLEYAGPGLRYGAAQEGRDFSDRTIDHNVIGEYQWSGMSRHVLKTRLLYIEELRRSGPSETYGAGLYNFWALGGAVLDDYAFRPGVGLGYGLTYEYFRFPNYSNLQDEWRLGNVAAASLGGEYDNHLVRLNGEARFSGKGRSWVAVSLQKYTNMKVKLIDPPFGDAATKQQDISTELGTSWLFSTEKSSSGRGQLIPSLRLTLKESNQNKIDPLAASSATGLAETAVGNFYSNIGVDLDLPMNWTLASGLAFKLDVHLVPTFFLARPPANAAGTYDRSARMFISPVVLTPAMTVPLGKMSRWTIAYSYLSQTSNNHDVRFWPYNYSGHFLFSSFDITY